MFGKVIFSVALATLGMMEDEGGEGSMEETFIKILHQMAWCLSHFCKDKQQLSPTKEVLGATTCRSSCQVAPSGCRFHQQ